MSKYLERNRSVRKIEIIIMIILFVSCLFGFGYSLIKINQKINLFHYLGEVTLQRDYDYEDYSEDNKYCGVYFSNEEDEMVITLKYQDYLQYDVDSIEAHKYLVNDENICLENKTDDLNEIKKTYRSVCSNKLKPLLNLSDCVLILLLSFVVIYGFGALFSSYEKIWFISIMVLASIFGIIFPDASANGVNGIVITLLYLLDTFLNILCELLISKQSRYNFLVSVAVEICEILICVVLMYRFATMVTTLFFWLPIDIISFINWSKHKDEESEQLTVVRKLKGYQEVLIIIAIVAWTVVVGYFLSGLDISSDIFGNNKSLETFVIYLDAAVSAVGICNGLFIFFRLQEQWIAWYLSALFESIINILTGQYVLLVLKLGYFTNTTYGYYKWNKYIKEHNVKVETVL